MAAPVHPAFIKRGAVQVYLASLSLRTGDCREPETAAAWRGVAWRVACTANARDRQHLRPARAVDQNLQSPQIKPRRASRCALRARRVRRELAVHWPARSPPTARTCPAHAWSECHLLLPGREGATALRSAPVIKTPVNASREVGVQVLFTDLGVKRVSYDCD